MKINIQDLKVEWVVPAALLPLHFLNRKRMFYHYKFNVVIKKYASLYCCELDKKIDTTHEMYVQYEAIARRQLA